MPLAFISIVSLCVQQDFQSLYSDCSDHWVRKISYLFLIHIICVLVCGIIFWHNWWRNTSPWIKITCTDHSMRSMPACWPGRCRRHACAIIAEQGHVAGWQGGDFTTPLERSASLGAGGGGTECGAHPHTADGHHGQGELDGELVPPRRVAHQQLVSQLSPI